MNIAASLSLALDEIILTLSLLALLLMAAWGGARSARLACILGVAALVAAIVAVATSPGGVLFDGLAVADAFAGFVKILIYASAAIALMLAPRWFEQAGEMRAEYPVLILSACIGMALMVMATDFLTLYIGLELSSLAAYVLAAFARRDQKSAEAGLKYFVLGALASGILLFGISLIYGFTGSTSFAAVGAELTGPLSTGAMFGLVFILVGLAFKIAAVPFHMWTPDVYEGAPTPVTAFFGSAPNVAAAALLIRVVISAFGAQTAAWQPILIFLALASILLGAVGAIGQQNLKRLLAYSAINNIGFLLIGLAAGTEAGVSGMLTYLAIYVAMTIGSFACVMALGEGRERLEHVAGLSRTRPALAAMIAMFMFSLAGVPPLFGFWAKLVVFRAAVDAGLIALAAIGIAASVIGAFYYLKVIKTMYFDEPAEAPAPAGLTLGLVAATMAVIISPLGYFTIPLLGAAADGAARSLF